MYDGRSDIHSGVRVGPSAVNVISITRRPEGGIVNVEVRRQEGSGPSQSTAFGSRESSPSSVIFAKTPPLPVDTRFRGFGGIALHGTDTGRLHRALTDHVRALHGQSLFDRFNEPAPPVDGHQSTTSSSSRRVHTIPIRIEGRNRPAGTTLPPAQRVYEIPVNVLSSSSMQQQPQHSSADKQGASQRAEPSTSSHAFSAIRSQIDPSSDAERKLARLMNQLENEMNSPSPTAKKQVSEISLTPVAVSSVKSPPPYHGPHITEIFGRPTLSIPQDSLFSPIRSSGSLVTSQVSSPIQSQSESGTRYKTIAVKSGASPESVEDSLSDNHCQMCGNIIQNWADACLAMGLIYHTSCFTCSTCQRTLRGKAFYEVQGKIYCEEDYMRTGFQELAVKCDGCGMLVLDVVVQALGKSYHRACFRCAVCKQCLGESAFTVDADKQLLCLPDYYRLHASTCTLCRKYIVPVEGSDDAIRVVMLDNEYCVSCFRCKDCGRQLSDRSDELCYPVLGILLCLACHQRRLADTTRVMTSAVA